MVRHFNTSTVVATAIITILINIVTSTRYYIRVDGCDHIGARCSIAATNFTQKCITNSGGSLLSPKECSCCDWMVPQHSCNFDYPRRRLLLSIPFTSSLHYTHINRRSLLTVPTNTPTLSPTQPPSNAPSIAPTQPPSNSPTQPPSNSPTQPPSNSPSNAPSIAPTQPPSISPSISPHNPLVIHQHN
eukprot:351586_1